MARQLSSVSSTVIDLTGSVPVTTQLQSPPKPPARLQIQTQSRPPLPTVIDLTDSGSVEKASNVANSSSIQNTEATGSTRVGISCSMPFCNKTISPGHIFCSMHVASNPNIDRIFSRSASAASNPPQPSVPQVARSMSGTSMSGTNTDRQPPPATSKNKTLPEQSADGRMTARKTASNGYPDIPPSRPSGSSIAQGSPILGASPKPKPSPPASQSQSQSRASSIQLRGGEPPKKRQRVSPSLGDFSRPQQNGAQTHAQQHRVASAPANQQSKPGGTQTTIRPAVGSYARPSKSFEGRQHVFKLSPKTTRAPVRKRAPEGVIAPIYSEGTSYRATSEQSERMSEPPGRQRNGWGAMTDDWTEDDERLPAYIRDAACGWDTRQSGNSTYQRPAPVPSQPFKTATQVNGYAHYGPGKQAPERYAYDRLVANHWQQQEEPRSAFWNVVKGSRVQPVLVETRQQSRPLEVRSREEPKRPKAAKVSDAVEKVPQNTTVKMVDEALFDQLFYAQDSAQTPPPGVAVPSPTLSAEVKSAQPLPPDEPLYAHIDPRVHWPQRHSDAWYAAKAEEIKARGGKRAWLGKAAHRLRLQRAQDESSVVPFEDTLPDKIRQNPAWVRVLKRLNGIDDDAGNTAVEKPVRRRPGLGKKQSSNQGSSNGTGVRV